jgi:hypothetical protein
MDASGRGPGWRLKSLFIAAWTALAGMVTLACLILAGVL